MGNAKELKWGYISHSGEFAITPAFYGAGDFCDGLAAVKVDCGSGFIDREGNFREGVVTPPVYEPECGYNPQYELHDGLVRFVENQKFGYKDKDGNVVIKAQFFDAGDFSEGLACVKKGKTSIRENRFD